MTLTDADVQRFIIDALEQNFELLKLESGHSLAADVKATALNQALLYWLKLKDIATRVTETEVRLNLPGCKTSQGRKFGIEGVVDIVKEADCTVMYDIKTHDADQVRDHIEGYEDQLNIYAFIWQNLRGLPLDEIAIIATAYPDSVRDALADKDPARITYELDRWDPLVEIDLNPEHVDAIITDFGRVVDCIENGEFEPASMEKLNSRYGAKNSLFATNVCRNCDARFSCDSYRTYSAGSRRNIENFFRQYLNDYGTDLDQQERLSSGLESTANLEELES
jgi:hypothetical protein